MYQDLPLAAEWLSPEEIAKIRTAVERKVRQLADAYSEPGTAVAYAAAVAQNRSMRIGMRKWRMLDKALDALNPALPVAERDRIRRHYHTSAARHAVLSDAYLVVCHRFLNAHTAATRLIREVEMAQD